MAKAKETSPEEAPRPERWSAQQKTEVVLRLLRGEDLGEVSREIQVPAHELVEWRRVFLDSVSRGLNEMESSRIRLTSSMVSSWTWPTWFACMQ